MFSDLEPGDEAAPPIFSVSQLSAQIKELMETAFPAVWVSGEISNFSRPQSGHCYLTLKDEQAQIKAVVWRNTATRLRFDLRDGLEVICQGNLDVYAPRGTYQLVIRQIEPKGVGALELALRKLRDRLTAEGLFDPARKRPLPLFPRRVAFVTSPTGAAVRDFLEVLRRRWRGVDVLVIPARVQGAGAAEDIARGIALANRLRHSVDVLVVGRGGGSLEDLWAFNEEVVVRAIHDSRIPIISAVGHEIDVTLADLVADVRALTPSEAAERIAPSEEDIRAVLRGQQARLLSVLRRKAQLARLRLDGLAARRVLQKPRELMHDRARYLDEQDARLSRAVRQLLDRGAQVTGRLAAKIESLSPLAVLGRGYSITQRSDDGTLVRAASELQVGQTITTRLADGTVRSRIEHFE